jgi:hypothetical protein
MELQAQPELEPVQPQYNESVDADSDEIPEETAARAEAEEELSDDEHEGNLCRFLVQARLGHYVKKLSALGAATTDDLFELGPEELEEIGMRKLERTRLARFLQRYVLARPRLQDEGREVPVSLSNVLALPPGQKPRCLVQGWVSRAAKLHKRIVVVVWRLWVQHERLAEDLDQAKAAEIAAVQSRALLRSRCDQAEEALAQVAATGQGNEAVTRLAAQLREEQWEAEDIEAAAITAEQAAAALALPLPQAAEAMRSAPEKALGDQAQEHTNETSASDEADPPATDSATD